MVSFSKIVLVIFLLLLSAAVWYGNTQYPHIYLENAFYTLLVIAGVYFIFRVVLENAVMSRVKETRTKYSLRKAISVMYVIVLCVAVFTIWVPNPEALFVAYGLLAAGIAIALQDLFKNLAGGVLLFLTRLYSVGDRVEIDSHFGDVVDIDIFYTTILETRGWIEGDQASGRLTMVPNGHILSGITNNYTKDHDFIWDEIHIPLTYGSDWKAAVKLFTAVVEKQTAATRKKAAKQMSRIREKYYFEKRVVEPQVFVSLTDNWVSFNIRYVTAVRERRQTHDLLSRELLKAIEASPKLKIASQTIDIVGFPKRK